MLISELTAYSPYVLLLLRILVAIIFIASGWRHLKHLRKRARSIGLPIWVTAFVGTIEIVAGLALALGIFTQIAAGFLVAIMAVAIGKKIFSWNVGYFADEGVGWHYELLLLALNLLFITSEMNATSLL